MVHVIKTLTGVDISPQIHTILEQPEKAKLAHAVVSHQTRDVINRFKITDEVERYLVNTFMVMAGARGKALVVNSEKTLLVEESFLRNIKTIIGVDCPFFGKMLYLQMAEGFEGAKISLH